MRVGRDEEQRKEKRTSDYEVLRARHCRGAPGRHRPAGSPCQRAPTVGSPSASHITTTLVVHDGGAESPGTGN